MFTLVFIRFWFVLSAQLVFESQAKFLMPFIIYILKIVCVWNNSVRDEILQKIETILIVNISKSSIVTVPLVNPVSLGYKKH